ncbi:MAG: MFS transporter [Clostridiales bacterium]|nr:MFS transporter [Clostridiales bacterium]
MDKCYSRVKYACYASNITMAVIGNLPPVLFLTFRNLYGISFTLLGTLVLINFLTQLSVDLIFSFFSHKFNIILTVKLTPVIAALGLVLFSLAPTLFPNAVYAGFVLGTFIFAASSGLAEVLLSSVVGAIPSENPDKEMSKLHSIYAWGVVAVIIIATVYLLLFDNKYWQWLSLGLSLVPLISFALFLGAKFPKMETPEKATGALALMKSKALWLCVFGIFLGGASEVSMAQWSSGYLEEALKIKKVWGDVFGVAGFGLMLGLGRTMYAKKGKNIEKVLFLSALGAFACYVVAILSNIAIIGLIACAMTGFCTAMLWPGSLIVAAEKMPTAGVFMYAMMAAGGDLGASAGPQLVGAVTDAVAKSGWAVELADSLHLSIEQLSMKAGMAVGAIFPLLAIFVFLCIWKTKKKQDGLPLQTNE